MHARTALVFTLALVSACAPVSQQEIAATDQALNDCSSATVEGIDVSEFQGTIDWTMVANSRRFAVARIADGGHTDADFARNYAGIAAAGMIRGAYLFWRPQISAATQAQTIINAVGTLGPGDLPPTIDVECMCPYHTGGACGSSSYSDCVSPATAATMITDLYNLLEAHYGRPPMIYTGRWFWDGSTYLNGALQLPSAPLWVSGYVSCANAAMPSGWTDWRIWQYSDGNGQPAIPGSPNDYGGDRDRWHGDIASLMAFTGGGGNPTPVYGATFVAQSFPYSSVGPVNIPAGGSATAWIDLRNSGTADWDGMTCLGTTVARDRPSPVADPSWPNDHRLDCVPSGMTVAPGATHRFSWTWTVPVGTAPGTMFDEHYDLVEEGVHWFGDPGQGGPPDNDIEGIIAVTAPVDSGLPPVDAYVAPRDAYVAVDGGGGMPIDGGSTMSMGDATSSTDDGGGTHPRALSGSCGCVAAGASHGGGAWLLGLLLAIVIGRRKRA